ncbi:MULTISPECIES: hypothetical protein [unclassified Microcoleus]|uniref:hypothetical protein n=1 Tax=unclassified Microcoleus TaxID=2642155 RepID=UPI002FD64235
MAYLPIACTENDRPRQQNPTASITNTYLLSESVTCRSRRQNPWHLAPPADRRSLQGSLDVRAFIPNA